MSDDPHLEFINNKLQLQQVEAALELDKDNQELLQLRDDLKEVIKLTVELIGKSPDEAETRWHVGDQCLAMCSRDKLYYRATILEFVNEANCVVNFTEHDTSDVCQIANLKPVTSLAAPMKKKKRDEKTRAIEKKKSKKLKLIHRHEEIERVCETQKNDWLSFSKKMYKQGKPKKSIFATPESNTGRVGVGTCGISGKPMTKFLMSQANRK